MSDAHARLSPSGSKRWLSCAGSITLEAPFPNTSSEHADRGTAAHIVAAECLRETGLVPSDWLMDRVKVSNPGEEDRFVEFTEDLCEMVSGYVDIVKELARDNELLVEQRVDFSEFVGVPGQFGTADAIIFRPDGEMLLIDLKTGYKYVGVENNSQLMLYALGALRMFELAQDIRSVRLMIYQPTHGAPREWVIPVGEFS